MSPSARSLVLSLAVPLVLGGGACFSDAGQPGTTDAPGSSTGPGTTSSADPTDASSTTSASSSTGPADTGTGDITTSDTTTACLDLWYLDIDGDSYGGEESQEGCGPPPPGFTLESLDCDDARPQVHPGADELCDGLDNDCDLGVDEWPAGSVEACSGCTARAHAGHYYYFCVAPEVPWDDARVRCQVLLGDLAIVDDSLENDYIHGEVDPLVGKWWLGLSDLALEGQFLWVDGTPLDPDLDLWAADEPNNVASDAAGAANCVTLVTDLPLPRWRDQVCSSPRRPTCEASVF